MNRTFTLTRWAVATIVAIIMAPSLLVSGCGLLNNSSSVGDMRTETQTVELGSANEVKAYVKMGGGELSVAGNADSLMDATFRYNVADWQPRVNYNVNGSQGDLVVDHRGKIVALGASRVNEWSLRFSNAVPIDLEIETGGGKNVLDLRGLDLTNLGVQIGGGIMDVDLSSNLDRDLNVTISSGAGELSVKLPAETGVRVSADMAIGSLTNTGLVKDGRYYVNDAYGVSPHTLFINIDAAVGTINLLAP